MLVCGLAQFYLSDNQQRLYTPFVVSENKQPHSCEGTNGHCFFSLTFLFFSFLFFFFFCVLLFGDNSNNTSAGFHLFCIMARKRKGTTGTSSRNIVVTIGVVVISIFVAYFFTAPLLNPKHAVATHNYRPGQQFFQNAQKLWIFTRHWLPAPDQAPK